MNTFEQISAQPEISRQQYGMMKNALGLVYAVKPYRNYFASPQDGETREAWDDLVDKGLAIVSTLPIKDREEGSPWRHYSVSLEGHAFLGVIPEDST